jgi:hypothetical protein
MQQECLWYLEQQLQPKLDLPRRVRRADGPERSWSLIAAGASRVLEVYVEEAALALVSEGIISPSALTQTLAAMHEAAEGPKILILAPRMSLVWARRSGG